MGDFCMLLRSLSFASALCVALLAGCASPVAHDGAADLVPVAQWAPDVVQDMRYFGAENFFKHLFALRQLINAVLVAYGI